MKQDRGQDRERDKGRDRFCTMDLCSFVEFVEFLVAH